MSQHMGKPAGPVDTRQSPHARLRTLAYTDIRITDGFWAHRQAVNRTASLRHGYRMLEKAGNFHNLRLAAGLTSGPYKGMYPFLDSDVHKWLEALAYELANAPDPELEGMAKEAIDLLALAQQGDGYLDSYYTVAKPADRWKDLQHGHEMYCAGHLFQAAVAHHRLLGNTKLLGIATRFADHIDSIFGWDKRRGICGHPEVEMALIELYRQTGEKRYLNLAMYFLDDHGHGVLGVNEKRAAYYQDHVPVREAVSVEGHAVRALYLTSGVADAYLETGDAALLTALQRQWHDMVSHKLYLTGGVGSRIAGEAFGEPYELPNDIAYCETCAQIASIMWSWRMLLITGEARFADLIERTLYNGFLSGVSLDGLRTRYENPLLRRGYKHVLGPHGNERAEWFDCACCPPNIMRLLSSLAHYIATEDTHGVQIHQYVSSDIAFGPEGANRLHMQTEYPWRERIEITVTATHKTPWRLSLRLPSWCTAPSLAVNDTAIDVSKQGGGYASIERTWQAGDKVVLDLPMPPRLMVGHPRVDTTRGCVAIERGPIVYCLEQFDQPEGVNLMDVQLQRDAPLTPVWRGDLLDGVMTIETAGYALDTSGWGNNLYYPLATQPPIPKRSITLIAIPYYAWDNRGLGSMRVWIPCV